MQKIEQETGVTCVDKANNSFYLSVSGCQVIATCAEQDNADLYDKVKDILVDSFFHSPTQGNERLTGIP